MRLHRFSMPRAAQGNFDQMRLLTAHLSLEAMLVRETVQNAWDARDPERGNDQVVYALEGGQLRGERRDLLADLFRDRPTGGLPPAAAGGGSTLSQVLNQRAIPYLIVSDRNTVGLGGPGASNIQGEPTQARFARFLLDMGRPPGIDPEGGTYGYGKTVLWRASECATVLVYSQFRLGNGVRSRLMGAAMGDSYSEAGELKTGRHWWGVADEQFNVLPVESQDARDIADRLGMWSTDDRRTGTSVLVIGSQFHTPHHMESLREAARWHCWPKWSRIDETADVNFEITVEGESLRPLNSDADRRIGPFVDALRRVLRGDGTPCEVQRPRVDAGHFAVSLAPRPPDEKPVPDVSPIEGTVNHVAWVRRGPGLHVRFQELPGQPPEGMQRAVVFLTGEQQEKGSPERAFAEAEPPTHDDWVIENMPGGRNKTIVRVGLRQLNAHLDALFAPQLVHAAKGDGLGTLANALGGLLDAGEGPSRPTRRPGKGDRKELRIIDRGSGVELADGVRWAVFRFKVEGRGGRNVELSPSVAVVDSDRRSSPITEQVSDRICWTWDYYDEAVSPVLMVEGGDPDDKIECWVPMDEPRLLRVGVNARIVDD